MHLRVHCVHLPGVDGDGSPEVGHGAEHGGRGGGGGWGEVGRLLRGPMLVVCGGAREHNGGVDRWRRSGGWHSSKPFPPVL